MNIKELLKKNIAFNGYLLQKIVAIEEMSELAKEITKDLRGIGDIRNLAEEIADVEIVIEELKMVYDIEDIVREKKLVKLERILKRLEEK